MNRRLWLSRSRRLSAGQAFTCPTCQEPSHDPVAATLGYCAGCKGFTGLCAVGRVLCRTDAVHAVTCTDHGEVPRRLLLPDGSHVRVLLCAVHDAETNFGSWVTVGGSVPPPGFHWPQ